MEFLRRWVLKWAGFARVVTGQENMPGREIGKKKNVQQLGRTVDWPR